MNTQLNLMNSDCLELMQSIPDKSVDMVLCDLPYGEVNRKSNGLRILDKGLADICDIDFDKMFLHFDRIVKGSVYLFCGIEQVSQLRKNLVDLGFSTRLCIWEKTNPSPMNGQHLWLSSVECCVFGKRAKATFNEHCQSSVWRNACGRNRVHPTEKPLKLMERIIAASSNVGDTVLDNCMGSGTTGVACVNLGRNFIGIEKDENYFKIASDRISKAMVDKQIAV